MIKPNIFVTANSKKGFSLTDPVWQKYYEMDGSVAPDMSVREAYTKQSWFRRCVDIRTNAISNIPFEVLRVGSDDPLWQSGQPMPPEIEALDIENFIFKSAASLPLVGRAYAFKEGEANANGEFKKTLTLKWQNPETIEEWMERGTYGPDEHGNFTHFKRTVGSRQFYIPREFIVHAYASSPFVEQGHAESVGEAAVMGAQVLIDLGTFTKDQLRSGLIKKTVFVADTDARQPSEQQLDRWRKWITRFLLGAKGTQPEVMQGLDTKEIGASLADLHSREITESEREAIASAFGIPHSLVMSNAANYATARTDLISFYEMTALPDARIITRALNTQCLSDLGLYCRHRPEKMEIYQSAELEKAQAIANLSGGRPLVSRGRFFSLMGWTPTDEELQDLDSLEERMFEKPSQVAQDTKGVYTDIQRWRKKIKKYGREVKFSPDTLGAHETSVIVERLAGGQELEDAFKPPFTDF